MPYYFDQDYNKIMYQTLNHTLSELFSEDHQITLTNGPQNKMINKVMRKILVLQIVNLTAWQQQPYWILQ